MTLPRLTAILAIACATAATALADEKLDLLKSRTDRWIDVQQRLAKERSDWLADKAILKSTTAALESSRASLAQRLDNLEASHARMLAEREAAEARLAEHAASDAALVERLAAFERRAAALGRSLPDPLKEKLAPSLEKLRAAGDAGGSASARIQNLLSILAQIDEFNNSLAFSHVIRELPGGETIDVRVLYWGLAFAYAADAGGTRAWMLAPGAEGWDWIEQDARAAEIAALLEVYEKTASPALIVAPARVANRRKEAAQ